MIPSQLWDNLHELFDTDDGSFPEIWLTNLTGPQVEAIYSFFRSHGKDVTAGRTMFWDNQLEQDRLIESVENAAALVVQGIANPIYMVMGGLVFNGTSFVYKSSCFVVLKY